MFMQFIGRKANQATVYSGEIFKKREKLFEMKQTQGKPRAKPSEQDFSALLRLKAKEPNFTSMHK